VAKATVPRITEGVFLSYRMSGKLHGSGRARVHPWQKFCLYKAMFGYTLAYQCRQNPQTAHCLERV
jgi:hypothetical protein